MAVTKSSSDPGCTAAGPARVPEVVLVAVATRTGGRTVRAVAARMDGVRARRPAGRRGQERPARPGQLGRRRPASAVRLDLDRPTGPLGSALSGGEQLRLHLARAVLARPDVLLVDEPANGLGAAEATTVLAVLSALLPTAALLLAVHGRVAVPKLAGMVSLTEEAPETATLGVPESTTPTPPARGPACDPFSWIAARRRICTAR